MSTSIKPRDFFAASAWLNQYGESIVRRDDGAHVRMTSPKLESQRVYRAALRILRSQGAADPWRQARTIADRVFAARLAKLEQEGGAA